jgi:hypothetical protein
MFYDIRSLTYLYCQFLDLWKELELSGQVDTNTLLPLMVFIACLCPEQDFDSRHYRGRFYKEENLNVGLCIYILQQHWPAVMPAGEWGRQTITVDMLERAVSTQQKQLQFANTFNITLDGFVASMKKKQQKGFKCILLRIFKVLNLPYKKKKRGLYELDEDRFKDYLKLCVFWKSTFRHTIESAGVDMPII